MRKAFIMLMMIIGFAAYAEKSVKLTRDGIHITWMANERDEVGREVIIIPQQESGFDKLMVFYETIVIKYGPDKLLEYIDYTEKNKMSMSKELEISYSTITVKLEEIERKWDEETYPIPVYVTIYSMR